MLVIESPDQEFAAEEGLDHPIRACEDMLYNICTNDIFRSNLPMVDTRIYIEYGIMDH
jgi:hypothetical protein